MRSLVAVVGVAVIGACASTGRTDDVQDPGPGPADGQRYLDPVFEDVEVTADVEYRRAEDFEDGPVTLLLNVYEPAGDTAEERPVVFFVFGGGFIEGDRTSDAAPAKEMAQRGYVAVTIDYRLRDQGMNGGDPVGTILDAYDDATAALGWLREHAAEHRMDPEATVAIGSSAGAVVAWNLAWLPTSPESPRPGTVQVAATVSLVGAPAVSKAAPGAAPVLAFNGGADDTFPLEIATGPCVDAAAAGVRCDQIVFEGAGHLIDTPGDADFQDDVRPCYRQFIAEAVLVDAGYVPADAVGPACAAADAG